MLKTRMKAFTLYTEEPNSYNKRCVASVTKWPDYFSIFDNL